MHMTFGRARLEWTHPDRLRKSHSLLSSAKFMSPWQHDRYAQCSCLSGIILERSHQTSAWNFSRLHSCSVLELRALLGQYLQLLAKQSRLAVLVNDRAFPFCLLWRCSVFAYTISVWSDCENCYIGRTLTVAALVVAIMCFFFSSWHDQNCISHVLVAPLWGRLRNSECSGRCGLFSRLAVTVNSMLRIVGHSAVKESCAQRSLSYGFRLTV